jgi:orotidine-5'-phosphate decarboxylase
MSIPKNVLEQTIVALDGMSLAEVFNFLNQCKGQIPRGKIGLELFNSFGPEIVNKIYDQYKLKIFLDLKLHDIPQTVYQAIKSLQGLPVEFLTIHLSGLSEMIQAALKARDEFLPNTKLLGVTYLTSLSESELQTIYPQFNLSQSFLRLVQLAEQLKMDGLILSGHELPLVKSSILKVCPGIRLSEEGPTHDQKRVMTAQTALSQGADFLVIGRALTQAKNLEAILALMKSLY